MSEELRTLTPERVNSYLDITRRARAKATPLVDGESPEGKHLATMMRMADDYASDAQHFLTSGDLVRAFDHDVTFSPRGWDGGHVARNRCRNPTK